MRRWVLGAALWVFAAEATIRWVDPTPRTQVVRGQRPGLWVEPDGLLMWRWSEERSAALRNEGCQGDHHVVLAGDSIWYVAGAEDLRADGDSRDQTVGSLLQGLLPGTCVHNVSQPGFFPAQQARAGLAAVQQLGAKVLVVEVWKDDRRYVQLGKDWYDLDPYELDEGQVPTPWGAPIPAARWWFTHSAFVRYAALATHPPKRTRETFDDYAALLTQARELGVVVVFVEMSWLNAPFVDSCARRRHGVIELERRMRGVGAPWVTVCQEWADKDPSRVRIDPVHFNAEGHEWLAETLAPVVGGVVSH